MSEPLRAEHVMTYSYRRSVGGAQRLFLEGLGRAEIWACRTEDGRVVVPPVDWDPETGHPVVEFLQVSGRGVVRSWTWVSDPAPDHPLDHPFAFALIGLDGSDTSILHVVDVADEGQIFSGLAVEADWRAKRTGRIVDIRAFVACEAPGPTRGPDTGTGAASSPEVTTQKRVRYTYEPGWALSEFLTALAQRRIFGGRCPSCGGVYVPPHATCPACRTGPMQPVELGDEGVVTAFTVVHIPVPDVAIEVPFVAGWIQLDGASVPFAHLIGGADLDQVRVGQRVGAVWGADQDLAPTWESIRYFRLLERGIGAP